MQDDTELYHHLCMYQLHKEVKENIKEIQQWQHENWNRHLSETQMDLRDGVFEGHNQWYAWKFRINQYQGHPYGQYRPRSWNTYNKSRNDAPRNSCLGMSQLHSFILTEKLFFFPNRIQSCHCCYGHLSLVLIFLHELPLLLTMKPRYLNVPTSIICPFLLILISSNSLKFLLPVSCPFQVNC